MARHGSRPRRRRGRRRRRLAGGRLGGIVVGDDAANRGENFLHRRLLRLRRLAHCQSLQCRIPAIPTDARGIERPQRITRSLNIYSDRCEYGTAYFERQRSLVDRHTSRALRRRLGKLFGELFGDYSGIIFRRACARPPRCRAPDGSAPSDHRSAQRGPAPSATTAPPLPAANTRRPPGHAGR